MDECIISAAEVVDHARVEQSQLDCLLVNQGRVPLCADQDPALELPCRDWGLSPQPHGHATLCAGRTRVVFGPGALATVPDVAGTLVRDAGCSARALLVVGGSSGGQRWRSALVAAMRSFAVTVFEHPAGGPTAATVAGVVGAARRGDASLLIAAGGGGVMDATKAAASLLGENGRGGPEPLVLAIPTTPGTGAEVTPFATVWDHARGRKESVSGARVAPAAAVIDPELCVGLPASVLAASVLDTLTQGVEAAWSTNSTLESTTLGLSAVARVAGVYEDLLREDDVEALTVASLAGLESGTAIAISQTTACHAISYPLTLRLGLRHGDACSVTLGAMLAYNAAVQGCDCVDARGAERVRAVVRRAVRALGVGTLCEAQARIESFRRLGGLAAYGEYSPDSSAIAAEALSYGRACNNPRVIRYDQLSSMLRSLERGGD
jgi:alcohol dehydrogenase class IV